MAEISRRALDLLRDATHCELRIIERVEARHHRKTAKVVRLDGRGNEHQVKTLEALLRSGLVTTDSGTFQITPKGLEELEGAA